MATRKYKPSSPGRRHMMVADFSEITKSTPEKSLTEVRKRSGGRNNTGRITVFQRGGGHKRKYLKIDFKRKKWDVPAKVAAIEELRERLSQNLAAIDADQLLKTWLPAGIAGMEQLQKTFFSQFAGAGKTGDKD